MRLSPIRRTLALTAAVSAIALAATALAVAHAPRDNANQRVAEQYRGRYQLKLDEARNLLAAAPAAARGTNV